MASDKNSNAAHIPEDRPGTVRFGALLKERRKEARISQKDFAEMMNVSRNTVVNWEEDKSRPDYSQLPKVCALLGLKLHELFGMEPENGLSPVENRIVENVRQLSPSSRKVVDKMISTMVQEEILEKERSLKESFRIFLKRPGSLAAAGVGNFVPDAPPEYVFLRRNQINKKSDGIVPVKGDSMEPVYHNGDYVYYRNASCAQPGQDAVVDINGSPVIMRVGHDHMLHSVSPDTACPKKNDQSTMVISGVVLGVVSSSDMPADEDRTVLEECFADEIRRFNQ